MDEVRGWLFHRLMLVAGLVESDHTTYLLERKPEWEEGLDCERINERARSAGLLGPGEWIIERGEDASSDPGTPRPTTWLKFHHPDRHIEPIRIVVRDSAGWRGNVTKGHADAIAVFLRQWADRFKLPSDAIKHLSAEELLKIRDARRKPPPEPYKPLLDSETVAAELREGKSRRARKQPPAIHTLAMALVRLEGSAEQLAYEAATWHDSGLGAIARKLPPVDVYVARAKAAAIARGEVWIDEMEQEFRDEHAYILREADGDVRRLDEARQLVLEINERLDKLDEAYEAAKSLLAESYKAAWIAECKVKIDRAFKESLNDAVAHHPKRFRVELARDGMDAALELAKWLWDAEVELDGSETAGMSNGEEKPKRGNSGANGLLSEAGGSGPVYKPDGWTKGDLLAQANKDGKILSASRFDTIRERAKVKAAPKGGAGPHYRYSRADLRKLIAQVEHGDYLNKRAIAQAWAELLASSAPRANPN